MCLVEDAVQLDGILDYWTVVSLLIVSIAALSPLVALLYQLMGFHAMLGMLHLSNMFSERIVLMLLKCFEI